MENIDDFGGPERDKNRILVVNDLAKVGTIGTDIILSDQLSGLKELELKKLDLERDKNNHNHNLTRMQTLFTESQKIILLVLIGLTTLSTVGLCLYTLLEKDERNRQFAITALTGIISALAGLYAGQKIASK